MPGRLPTSPTGNFVDLSPIQIALKLVGPDGYVLTEPASAPTWLRKVLQHQVPLQWA